MQMSKKRKAEHQDDGPPKKKAMDQKKPQSSPANVKKQINKRNRTIYLKVSSKSSNVGHSAPSVNGGNKMSTDVPSTCKKKRPFFKKKKEKMTKKINEQKSGSKGDQTGVEKSALITKKKKFKKRKHRKGNEAKQKIKGKTESPHQKKPEFINLPRQPELISSNWKQLQQAIAPSKKKKPTAQSTKSKEVGSDNTSKTSSTPEIWFDDVDDPLITTLKKAKEHEENSRNVQSADTKGTKTAKFNPLVKQDTFSGLTKAVAMDCEMVGVGDGKESILARVSIVNHYGSPLYDKFVKPRENVTDYRTFVSGVRPEDLKNAEEFTVVQKEVSDIITKRLLVGHALRNDLQVLFLSHPKKDIRDTCRYRPFRRLVGGRTPGLKSLTQQILGVAVQAGEHSSVEDAQAAMRLYTMHRKEWERSIKEKRQPSKQKKKRLIKSIKGEAEVPV